jgi:cyclohexa-1,5-dienecarbonyl-CoA hydratase
MSEKFQFINLKVEKRVGRIALARPPVNVLDIAMMREIDRALAVCMGEREMVAVLFESSPEARAFSAGIAVEEHTEGMVYQMLDAFHNIFRTLQQLSKPTIAVVDGAALGGGCELAVACDIVIASERARFGQPEVKIGALPSVACVQLPRIIGEKRARELILTGELIDAGEALRSGLVNYVVPTAQLEQKTNELLARLRELSASVLEVTRRALDLARGRNFEDALSAIENLYLSDLMKTQDAQEGVEAFLAKRKPAWKNR